MDRHKHPWLRVYFMIATAIVGFFFGCHSNATDPAVTSIRDLLSDGTIVRMKVIHVPHSVEPYAAIQPYQMRDRGLDISREMVSGPFESLNRALQDTTATPVHRPPDFIQGKSTVIVEGRACYPVDVRWSCILYNKDNREVGSIFLGQGSWWGGGRMAIVGEKLLNVNRALISWFEDNFYSLFDEQLPAAASYSPGPKG